ncbi:MAG: hypothetical protein LC689_11195 [Myxococcales bacterium]|nr:hypothetical protein [Myxococcales bacterium]
MPFVALLLAAAVAEWNQPVQPFRIAGNLYYVGANEITSFLIATPAGHIDRREARRAAPRGR